MKYIYLCLITLSFILFISPLSYSQVSFGVKSGINIATTKDLIAYPKNRIGWYAGGFATIPLHKKFFLQTELLYSSKGNGVNQISTINGVYRFNYLNVPIQLSYKIDRKTCLFIGPELGYLIDVYLFYSTSENFNISNNYPSKFDFGLDIGLNYKITKCIGMEVRYNYGLKTLYYIDGAGVRHSNTMGANRVFQMGLNYLF